MCVCVCVCVVGHAVMFDSIIKTQYNFINNLSSFLIKCLGFRLELVDEFTKIVPSVFGPFII